MPKIEFLPLDWICSIRIMRVDTVWWNLGLFSHNLPFIVSLKLDFLKTESSAYPRGGQIPPPLERNPATVGTDQNTLTMVFMGFVLCGGFFLTSHAVRYEDSCCPQTYRLCSERVIHLFQSKSTWSLARYLALAAGSRDCSPHFSYKYPIY